MPRSRYARRVMLSRAAAILLGAVVAALAPMAWAAPVDHAWPAGFYDAADQDDRVLSALSLEGEAPPPRAFRTGPHESFEWTPAERPAPSELRWARVAHDRAPPSR